MVTTGAEPSGMLSHTLWVPGAPQVKERPRFNRKTGGTYTPKATHEAERYLLSHFEDVPTFDGPVEVFVDYHPEGQLIRIREVGWASPLKGDADNYLKLTLDALQLERLDGTRVIADDSLVVSTRSVKRQAGLV